MGWQQRARENRAGTRSRQRRNYVLRPRSWQRRNLGSRRHVNAHQGISHDPLDAEPSAVVVKVDTSEAALPILGLTFNAQLLLGPSAGIGSSFARFIPRVDPFIKWMQENVNYHFNGAHDNVVQPGQYDVTLQTHDSSEATPFRCTMRWDDEANDVTHVCLAFQQIVQTNGTGSNLSSSSSWSSSSSSNGGSKDCSTLVEKSKVVMLL